MNSRGWLCRTRRLFMIFSSEPVPERCYRLLPIRNISRPRSVSSACFTPGDRIFNRTLTHNAWHYHLIDFQGTARVDFPCDPLAKGACRLDGGARGCSEPALCPDRSAEFPKEHAGRLVRGSIGRPPPAVRSNGDSRRTAEPLHSS